MPSIFPWTTEATPNAYKKARVRKDLEDIKWDHKLNMSSEIEAMHESNQPKDLTSNFIPDISYTSVSS